MTQVLKNGARRLLVLAPLLLAGCAAGSYCEGSQKYQDAASVPAIQSAEGLQLKESTSALKIPPLPETKVPYGETYVDNKGKEAVRCLDQPPELPPQEPKPAEPAAPAAPPADAPAKPG